jgi:hypothetical protein
VATSHLTTISLALAGWTIVVAPAHACDSNYPWLCPPVPSIDPPADAPAEPAKATKPAKPQAAANRHAKAAAAKAGKAAAAKATARKIAARKAAMRRFAARGHMKIALASRQVEATAVRADSPEPRTSGGRVPVPNRRPVVAAPREADGSGGASNGFASVWADRSVAAMEAPAAPDTSNQADVSPTAQAETSSAAPVAPAAVAPRSEPNEIDLAAATPPPEPADQSWVRSLFLAFGGLLAAGTALRFFI